MIALSRLAALRARGHAAAATLLLALPTLLAGCVHRTRGAAAGAGPAPAADASTVQAVLDPATIYRQVGLIADDEPIALVGNVQYLAGRTPDSTLVMVSLSMPSRTLSFTRVGTRFRAAYDVTIDLRQGATTARHAELRDTVWVATYKETARSEESIIFQHLLAVPPGQYVIAIAIRDAGSAKESTNELLLTVPRFGPGTLASPIAVYEATPRATRDSLPVLVTDPRAMAVFGRDSALQVYLEAYGDAGSALPIRLAVEGDQHAVLWSDTVSLPRHGSLYSGTITLPVAQIGVGPGMLVARRADGGDSTRSPIVVALAEGVGVASFSDMLDLLRYFATPDRLRALRDTAPADRAAAWAAFVRETDPVLSTPENEAMRDYFQRIVQANERFRDEGLPGWLTERGMVYVTLGEPDQVYEQGSTDISQRGRAQIWEYAQYHVQLVFIDQTGFGRWRLTTASEADFQQIAQRVRSR